jgi:predicted 3-demethylubiquinone-9 3-methyltransferase (glyoxalase superfamily)
MNKIIPFLWFNGRAEEAMKFYTAVFPNSRPGKITRYTAAGPGRKGSVMSATFQLEGQKFIALNGGPRFKFSPAISFFISCETQREIDRFWKKLSSGGVKRNCGWLQDKFGVSWQVVPTVLWELLHGPDGAKTNRVMEAMMRMNKLDIKKLKAAAARG